MLLGSRNSEAFKGLNDLIFASNGDCYFTDQRQTGMRTIRPAAFIACRGASSPAC